MLLQLWCDDIPSRIPSTPLIADKREWMGEVSNSINVSDTATVLKVLFSEAAGGIITKQCDLERQKLPLDAEALHYFLPSTKQHVHVQTVLDTTPVITLNIPVACHYSH